MNSTSRNSLKISAVLFVIAIVSLSAAESRATSSTGGELEYAQKLMKDGMYDVAQAELWRFTEREVSPVLRQRALILLGDIGMARSDLSEARKLYVSAFEANPGGSSACEALKKAGEASALDGDQSAAVAVLEKIPVLFPDCEFVCQSLFFLGKAYLELGDFEQAVREFERVLSACEAERQNPELLYGLAKAESRLNPARARKVLEELVESHPGTVPGFMAAVDLAEELESQGNTAGSLAMLDRALKQRVEKSDRAAALFKRGRLLESLGEPIEAGKAFSECYSIAADSALYEQCNLKAQGSFLSGGRYRDADLAAERLLANPCSEEGRAVSLLTRAEAARAGGALGTAVLFLRYIRPAAEADSFYCLARLREAEAMERLSDFAAAESAYTAALRVPCPASLHARVLTGLAGLYATRLSSPERASLYYRLLVELYPGTESALAALRELASMAEKKHDYAEAAQLLRRLAREFPLSSYSDEALDRAEALDRLFPAPVGTKDMEALGSLISSAASGSLDKDRLLERAGEVFQNEFRSLEQARDLLEQGLFSCAPDRKHLALFCLVKVHLLLAEKARYLGQDSEVNKNRNVALKYLRSLVGSYANTQLGDDARLELIRAELEATPSAARHKKAADLYSEFLQEFPQTDRFDEALLRRAEALEALSRGVDDDFAVEAAATYDRLVVEFTRSEFATEGRARRVVMLCKAGRHEAAEREFEAMRDRLSEAPSAAQAAYELAECRLARRETGRAIELYSLVAKEARSRTLRERAIARKGDSYFVMGELDKAIAEYEYVLSRDPQGPFADDLLAKITDAYTGSGMLREASQALQRLTKEFPASALIPRLLMKKAEAEEVQGEFGAAKSTYEEVGRRFPGASADTNFVRRLARVSFSAGDFAASREAYEKLLKLDGSEELRKEAGRGSVLSLAKLGEESSLRKRLAWYLKSFPADSAVVDAVALEKGSTLYASGRYEEAYGELSRVEERLDAGARAGALVTMGLCKLKLGDPEGAASSFRRALEIFPQAQPDSGVRFAANFKLGTSLYGLSSYSEASQAYLDAARFCRESAECCEAWYNGALCLEKVEVWSEAAELYVKVAGECRGKIGRDAAFKAGYCTMNAGENRRAVELFTEALQNSEDEEKPEIQYWIGEAYAGLREFERAASEFLKVSYVYGEGTLWAVTARYKAGLAFEAAGKADAAIRQYRAIIQREGEQSEWGSMARERLLELSK